MPHHCLLSVADHHRSSSSGKSCATQFLFFFVFYCSSFSIILYIFFSCISLLIRFTATRTSNNNKILYFFFQLLFFRFQFLLAFSFQHKSLTGSGFDTNMFVAMWQHNRSFFRGFFLSGQCINADIHSVTH